MRRAREGNPTERKTWTKTQGVNTSIQVTEGMDRNLLAEYKYVNRGIRGSRKRMKDRDGDRVQRTIGKYEKQKSKRQNREGIQPMRIGGMEIRYKFHCMFEFGSREPGEFLISILVAKPSDLVKELAGAAAVDLRVYDLSDLVLGFAVDFDRRRGRLNAVRNRGIRGRLDHRNMENRMNGMHGTG